MCGDFLENKFEKIKNDWGITIVTDENKIEEATTGRGEEI